MAHETQPVMSSTVSASANNAISCEAFTALFDLSDGASPADTAKSVFMQHAERCSDCNELLTMWTALLPEFLSDRDQLSEEPAPFFFSRQRLLIQDTIEARSRGMFARWFESLFPAWNSLRLVPLRAGLLAVLLFASWTVCETGTLPFLPSSATQTADLSDDDLFSKDTLSVIANTVLSSGELLEIL